MKRRKNEKGRKKVERERMSGRNGMEGRKARRKGEGRGKESEGAM